LGLAADCVLTELASLLYTTQTNAKAARHLHNVTTSI